MTEVVQSEATFCKILLGFAKNAITSERSKFLQNRKTRKISFCFFSTILALINLIFVVFKTKNVNFETRSLLNFMLFLFGSTFPFTLF